MRQIRRRMETSRKGSRKAPKYRKEDGSAEEDSEEDGLDSDMLGQSGTIAQLRESYTEILARHSASQDTAV